MQKPRFLCFLYFSPKEVLFEKGVRGNCPNLSDSDDDVFREAKKSCVFDAFFYKEKVFPRKTTKLIHLRSRQLKRVGAWGDDGLRDEDDAADLAMRAGSFALLGLGRFDPGILGDGMPGRRHLL